MRLYEIVDFNPKQSKLSVDDQHARVKNRQAKYMGSGAFGTAYDMQSNKRLNQVTKVGIAGSLETNTPITKVEDDGWLSYIKAVHKAQQQGDDNPYFPRIDDLRIRKDANGMLSYTANLHRLLPFGTAKLTSNRELMVAACVHMFDVEPMDHEDVVKDIAYYIKREDRAHDPQLIAANQLIDSIMASNSNFVKDLHTGNIMWRITGTMPQLVIVDPIA